MFNYGAFFWNELLTDNVEAAKAYYAAVFGWTFESMSAGEAFTEPYWVARAPGIDMPVAGLMQWPAGEPGSRDWFAYIAVRDIDASVAASIRAGGQLMKPVFMVPGVGRIAIVLDAAGAGIGYCEPIPM